MDTIARTGSFAAAARELGKVPSALTYSVRQLEDALDVLLFDRSSRQAQLTAAGSELLHEGRRLLQRDGRGGQPRAPRGQRLGDDAVDQRRGHPVAADGVRAGRGLLRHLRHAATSGCRAAPARGCACAPTCWPAPGRRWSRARSTWPSAWPASMPTRAASNCGRWATWPSSSASRRTTRWRPSTTPLVDAQLVHHRAVAVADTAQRMTPITVNLLPGQDVLTVPSMRSQARGPAARPGLRLRARADGARRTCEAGHLVQKETVRGAARRHAALRLARRARRSAASAARCSGG